jgi:hypothetical protein
MGAIERLELMPDGANRLRISDPNICEEDWFDLLVLAVTEAQAKMNWSHNHINQLENEHHFCLSIEYEGASNRAIVFIDSLVSTMPIQLLRHTLHNMYMEDMRYFREDYSLPFDCNPVAHVGWRLVLPNVVTNIAQFVRMTLPTTGNEADNCEMEIEI